MLRRNDRRYSRRAAIAVITGVAALVAETEAPSRTAKQKQRRSLFARS
jgi:hypothetical protein